MQETYTVHKGDALFPRIDVAKEIAHLKEEDEKRKAAAEAANKAKAEAEKKAAAPAAEESTVDFTHEEEIDFDTFCKVELRVAEVRACENLKESKKLLHLTVFDGERERCILSGIAKWFKPEDLIGKKIGIVCNLAPRPMMKGKYVSEGMIFAADTADGGCSIAFYGDDTPVGSRIPLMTGPIFDTHAHYSARAFDADRFALLDSLPGKGVVGVCEQATHSGDAPKVLELAHKYSWVYAAVGIHPESLLAPEDCGEEGPAPTVSVYGGDWAAEMRALAPYYEDPKVVAVGECGLDYHWPVPKDAQLALFEAEIRLALELDKPIIVHDRSAHADVYALLKKYRPKGIVHCYSGSADDALWLAEQGLYIGFGGACTFKGAKRAAKAIAALPLERIVLETDCPYMAPEPVRGTRCDSSLIRYVGEYIASIKGEEPEQVFRQTVENACQVYNLSV